MVEASIIKGCLRNDLASQKNLYENCYSKIMGICLRYSKSTEEAREITHETFLTIYTNIKIYNSKTPFEDWMKQRAVKTAIHHLQKNKQNYAIVSTIHVGENLITTPDSAENEQLLFKLKKEKILKALQELAPAYRTVYNLFMIEEYTHAEIAQLLDISEETSKLNLSKAIFSLKKNLMQQIKG